MHLKTKNWGEAIMICLLSMKKKEVAILTSNTSNFDKGGGGWFRDLFTKTENFC